MKEKIFWWMVTYNIIVYSNEAFYSLSISTSCHLCHVSYSYVSAPNAFQQSLAAESAEINDVLKSETAIEDKPSEANAPTNIQAESRINNNDNFKV